MDHPLHPPATPPSPSRQHPQQRRSIHEEDWHRYTLHSPAPASPSSPRTPSASTHRYESLTGLLLQSGTPSSFGIDEDDESCKHVLNVDEGPECLDGARASGRGRGGRVKFLCWHMRYDSPGAILIGFLGIGMLGIILGLVFPSSSDGDRSMDAAQSAAKWDIISNILGYTYFLSWTLSFYPQIVTNWKHPSKARHGVSLDFVVWNIVGFACYAIYTTSFRYSDLVRREYADRFGHEDANGGDDTGNATAILANVLLGGSSSDHATSEDVYNGTIETNPFSNWTNWTNPFSNWTNWTDDDDSSHNDSSDSSNATHSESSETDAVAVPQVKGNDVAFAWHALILTIITFVQIVRADKRSKDDRNNGGWVEVERDDGDSHIEFGNGSHMSGRTSNSETIFPEQLTTLLLDGDQSDRLQQRKAPRHRIPHNQTEPMSEIMHANEPWIRRISFTTKCLILLLLGMCIAGAVMVACDVSVGYWGGGDQWQWLDYLYFLSFVKVGVSIVKYIPQVVLNYGRKSTSGWQIWNILLDFSGGTLSIVQLVGDSLAEAKAQGLPHSWTGIVGNPAKFGLGLISIFFDLIFMFQHYVLYRHPSS